MSAEDLVDFIEDMFIARRLDIPALEVRIEEYGYTIIGPDNKIDVKAPAEKRLLNTEQEKMNLYRNNLRAEQRERI